MKLHNLKIKLIFILLILFNLSIYSQENFTKTVLVLKGEDAFNSKNILKQKYLIKKIQPENRIVLNKLNQSEINLINAKTDPPTIGIVRELNKQILINYDYLEKIKENPKVNFIGDSLYVLTYSIESPDASGIRLKIEQSNIPYGIKFYIYNDKQQVFGPYSVNDFINDEYWSNVIFSSKIYFQIQIPKFIYLPKNIN